MIDDSQLVATLLEEGLADRATVDRGLEQTAETGQSLYETLITAQLVEEPELVEVVARLLDVPSRTVDPGDISADISALVPASMAHRNRVLPLERGNDGELLLGMANPGDSLAVDEIATHTGVRIRPILVGPSSLAAALTKLYPTADDSSDVADAVMDAFDGFEMDNLMGDVIPGDEWSDYFEEAAGGEDSSALSRDMQDRPSTDVLADSDVDEAVAEADEEEDLPEIEIIEELGQPIRRRPPSPYASLDAWDVDEAIEGESEILTAEGAEEFFTPTDRAVPEDLARDYEIEEEAPEIDDETSNLQEISESHTDALETQSGRTTVGVGVDHLEDDTAGAGQARPRKKKRVTVENTGKTALGVRAEATGELAVDEEDEEGREPEKSTDYGALGRAILKSGPEGKRKRRSREVAVDDETNVTAPKSERPTDPRDKEADKKNKPAVVALFEDDEEEFAEKDASPTHARSTRTLPAAPKNLEKREAPPDRKTDPIDRDAKRPRLATPVEWPDDIDARGLALALANLLVRKGILTIEEVMELARQFTARST